MFPDPEVRRKLYRCFQEKSIPAKLSVRLKNHFKPPAGRRTVHRRSPVLLEPQACCFVWFPCVSSFSLVDSFFLPLSNGLLLENSFSSTLCGSQTNLQVCLAASVRTNRPRGSSQCSPRSHRRQTRPPHHS